MNVAKAKDYGRNWERGVRFRASQFFTARKREIRSYFAFTIFRRRYFPHRSSLSRSMLIGWKKDSTRESRIVPGGIFFARGIALLSITDATRIRSTHTRTHIHRYGTAYALDLFMLVWAYETRGLPNVTTHPRTDTCANTPIVIMHPYFH